MNDVVSVDPADTMRGLMAGGIEQAERALLACEQAPCPVIHHFGPGVYIRELHMFAGTFAIGHRQKHAHMNVMLKGRVLMLQDDGSTVELAAPMMFTGQPGRKMGYVLEDVVWQNIYDTDERDIAKLEEMFLDKSDAYGEYAGRLAKCEHNAREPDRVDFANVLTEYGFDATTVQQQSENEEDQCPMPWGSWKVKTDTSTIQGVGVFLTSDAQAGEVLGPARLSGLRTPLGRYTNHSATPNARMELLPNGDIQLVAERDITGCSGGANGEEVTICYRKTLQLSGLTNVIEGVQS